MNRRLIFPLTFIICCICTTAQAQKMKNLEILRHFSIQTDSSTLEGYLAEADQKVTTRPNRSYTWFSGHSLQKTQGGFQPRLLDGAFICKYLNKQLKIKGAYRKGLKKGDWSYWSSRGILQRTEHYRKGELNGEQVFYDQQGQSLTRTHYHHGLRNGWVQQHQDGKWVLKEKYREGQLQPKKLPLWKRLKTMIFKSHGHQNHPS